MSDPMVRTIYPVRDIDQIPVAIGVDYDSVSITVGGVGVRLDRDAAEHFAQVFVAACWEAADQAAQMREASDGV
jgi:hypothetical protein